MPDPAARPEPPEPDAFLVGKLPGRMPDGGPRYVETPPDPYAPGAPPVAEPYNTVTASLFLLIVGYYAVRLWGRYGRHPFVASCLPILFVGGVGGTLYHAFRTRTAYFLMDVIPISLLGLAGAIYLLVRLARAYRRERGPLGAGRVTLAAGGMILFYLFLNGVLFRLVRPTNPQLTVNLSYASLALILLAPLAVVMVRTRFRHGGLVAGALAAFGIAWFCRLVDGSSLVALPMGTHWLWHTFGAVCTFGLVEYFYRLETEAV